MNSRLKTATSLPDHVAAELRLLAVWSQSHPAGIQGSYSGGEGVTGLDAAQWAVPAAQALISAMTSDLWTSARERFARILARRSDTADEVSEDLEESRQQLVDAGGTDEAREEISAEWLNRFRRALTRDPSLLDELRSLIDEHGEKQTTGGGDVTQHVSAAGGGIVFNQGTGAQHNQVHNK
jgi:hypothetical protein